MKKFFTALFTLCMCFVFCFSANATYFINEETVSIEEYELALQEEAAKYGIEFAVLDYDSSVKITPQMLNLAIEYFRNYAESIKITTLTEQHESLLRTIPSTGTFYEVFKIDSDTGYANMRAEVNALVDLQNGAVIKINGSDVYQYGKFKNFEDWTMTSITATSNSPSVGYVTLRFTGRAYFAYADPTTCVLQGTTIDVNESIQIKCM